MNNNQAIKIATMMLQAATYEAPFMTLHPIVTRKEGREETYQAIAKALSMLTGINAAYIIGQLIVSNGNNDMVLVIDVARYVDFAPTGKYRNIDTLRKRIQRSSDAMELDYLEDSGEIENIDPLTIQHLYR